MYIIFNFNVKETHCILIYYVPMFSVNQTITLYSTVIKKNKCVFVKEGNLFNFFNCVQTIKTTMLEYSHGSQQYPILITKHNIIIIDYYIIRKWRKNSSDTLMENVINNNLLLQLCYYYHFWCILNNNCLKNILFLSCAEALFRKGKYQIETLVPLFSVFYLLFVEFSIVPMIYK